MALDKITAGKVKEKIDSFKEPDGHLSSEEMETIDTMYDKVDTDDGKKEVRDYINSSLSAGETKKKLLDLLSDVEVLNTGYGMEALAEKSDSKFFNIILGNELAVKGYKEYFIDSKVIEKNKEFFPNGHDTLDLVYWKKITDEIGIKSAGGFAVDKIGGIFGGIIGKFSGEGVEGKDKKDNMDFDISKIGDLVEKLGKLGGKTETPTEKQKEKALGIMGKLVGYLTFMTKDYTENLNNLIEYGKKDKNGLRKLLDNPVVLDKVLKTGKYNKDGYNIDLKAKKVSFLASPDLIKSKKEFFKIAIDSTNGTGKTLDALKDKVKDLAGVFKSFGLDANQLKDFRESLKDIPLIGGFLYSLASFFLSDKLLDFMDENPWEKEFKKSGKNLQKFIKEDTDNIPFTVGEKDFENEATVGNIETFLTKVDEKDKLYFDAKQKSNGTSTVIDKAKQKTKGVLQKHLINDDNFWKNIFSENKLSNPIIEAIRLKAIDLKKDNLSTEEFFKKLNEVEISDPIVKIQPTQAQIEAKKDLATRGPKGFTNADILELDNKLNSLTKIPTTIELKSGRKVEITFADSKLKVDENDYVLKDGDLTDIKIENGEVILSKKDSEGTASEIKKPSADFGKLLKGLIMGTSVAGSIFITKLEKSQNLATATKLKKQTDLTAKNTELTDKKKKLSEDSKLLITEIGNLDKEIQDLTLEISGKIDPKIKRKTEQLDKFIIKRKQYNLEMSSNLKKQEDIYRIISEEANTLFSFDLIKEKLGIGEYVEIKELKRKEGEIKLNIDKIDLYIKDLKDKIKKLKANKSVKDNEKSRKISEKTTKENLLKIKTDSVSEIDTKLKANGVKTTSLTEELEKMKKTHKEELEKQEQEKKAKYKAQNAELNKQAKIEALSVKSFRELLEKPTTIESNKLVLEDGTNIIFDKNSKTIKFGGETFGIKETFIYKNEKKEIDPLITSLSFVSIYKNPKNKKYLISTLNDLKEKKHAKYKIVEFELKTV